MTGQVQKAQGGSVAIQSGRNTNSSGLMPKAQPYRFDEDGIKIGC